jgi:2,3-bisphosphoglycerate-independent phosphoglycerate mutase
VIRDGEGTAAGIRPEDGVIAFNFRADRMRQITAALSEGHFQRFDRGDWLPPRSVVSLTQYDDDFAIPTVFPPRDVEHPLARAISESGLAQFHCAETEKYAHVTYFFNGGREEPFPGEERSLVQSPKVATYDLQPEMSAAGVTERVVAAIESDQFPFIIVNFANCDMVGHTGVFAAAVEAVETVDSCLDRVLDALLARDGSALVTADHGNAEEMIDRATGGPMTAHTTNPVPVILVVPDDDARRHTELRQGCVLSAVAPTLLNLLGVPVPASMTSLPLL